MSHELPSGTNAVVKDHTGGTAPEHLSEGLLPQNKQFFKKGSFYDFKSQPFVTGDGIK